MRTLKTELIRCGLTPKHDQKDPKTSNLETLLIDSSLKSDISNLCTMIKKPIKEKTRLFNTQEKHGPVKITYTRKNAMKGTINMKNVFRVSDPKERYNFLLKLSSHIINHSLSFIELQKLMKDEPHGGSGPSENVVRNFLSTAKNVMSDKIINKNQKWSIVKDITPEQFLEEYSSKNALYWKKYYSPKKRTVPEKTPDQTHLSSEIPLDSFKQMLIDFLKNPKIQVNVNVTISLIK